MRGAVCIAALLVVLVGVVKADGVCDCTFMNGDEWPESCNALAVNPPLEGGEFTRSILCVTADIIRWSSKSKRDIAQEEEAHEIETRQACKRDPGLCGDVDSGIKAYNPARYGCSLQRKACFEVPPAWRCDPGWFDQSHHTLDKPEPDAIYGNGTKNACHCGCGYPDPDCGTPLAAENIFCNAPAFSEIGGNSPVAGDVKTQYCNNPTGSCKTVPDGWTCPAYLYNEAEAHALPGIKSKFTCDCNCGVWDPDCDVATRTSCWLSPEDTNYNYTDSTDMGTESYPTDMAIECDSDSDCVVPPAESESSESESESESASESESESSAPTPIIGSASAICVASENMCVSVPAGWLCPARWYNETGTGSYGPNGIPDCNCGCGIPDPDCDYQSRRTTQGPRFFGLYADAQGDSPAGAYMPVANPKDICNSNTGEIIRVPTGWSCLPTEYNEYETGMYGDNGQPDCNCGCGDVYDPDCDYQDVDSVGLVCNGNRVSTNTREFCAKSTNTCELAPQAWVEYCPAVYYGEVDSGSYGNRGMPFCDCNCGETQDPDCEDQEMRFKNASSLGLACGDSSENVDNALLYCTYQYGNAACRAAPSTWTCSPSFYNELKTGIVSRGKPYCDCACGAWDEDCYTDTRPSAGFGSFGLLCSTDGPESSDIRELCSKKNVVQNQVNNAGLPVCTKAPDSWYCAGLYWNEFDTLSYDVASGFTCDCGCGLYDYDCNSTILLSSRNYLRCGSGGSRMLNVLGNYIDCSASCPFCELSDNSKKPQ